MILLMKMMQARATKVLRAAILVATVYMANNLAAAKGHGAAMPSQCTAGTKAGKTCTLQASLVHPTQFVLGMQEVRSKTEKFSEMSTSDLQEYTVENPVPCILGPNGIFYAIDHHHLTASVMLSSHKEEDKNVVVLVKDTSLATSSSVDDFYKSMTVNGWVWLEDEKGVGPINPKLLPSSMGELVNDPYRSLAYNVRKAGGYNKVSTPYQDFLWANYFRKHDLINTPSPGDKYCSTAPYAVYCLGGVSGADTIINSAQYAAMQLARSSDASDLPGYITGITSPDLLEKSSGNDMQTDVSTNTFRVASLVTGICIGVAALAGIFLVVRRHIGNAYRGQRASPPLLTSRTLLAVATSSANVKSYDTSSNAGQMV